MTSDSALPDLLSTGLLTSEVNDNLQVHFKSEEGQLLLILPAEAETLALQLAGMICGNSSSSASMVASLGKCTTVHLIAADRL